MENSPDCTRLAVVALAVVFLGGCAQSNVWDARMGATGLAAQDAITIVFVGHNYSPYTSRGGYSSRVGFASRLEQKVGRCISRALHDIYPTLRVVEPDEFRLMAFPERAPEDVPPRPWEQLVNEAAFQERIAPLNIRYLIAVNVSRDGTPMEYDVTYGEGGVAFGWKGEHWSSMNATVVDVAHSRVSGSMTASVTDDEAAGIGVLIGFPFSIPFPYWKPSLPTEGQACQELGKRVAGFLTSEEPPREDPGLAMTNNTMANLFRLEGRYAAAEPLYRRALYIAESALGPDHPDVMNILDNLAALYDEQARYAAAEPIYKRVLAIREQTFGIEHPSVATSLNNLAMVYEAQSNFAETETLLKRALSIDEKVLGPDHPSVAPRVNSLAELYHVQGRYAEAEPLYERALALWKKALRLGSFPLPAPSIMAGSLNHLAEIYEAKGRYAEAEMLYHRVLATAKPVLGSGHPAVVQSLNKLAGLYDELGRYDEAGAIYQQAVSTCEKTLRWDDPDSVSATHGDPGWQAEVEPLYMRALVLRERAFGPDHANVARSLENLACLYHAQDKYAEAEQLYRRALTIREKILGSDHPAVIQSLNKLAGLYDKLGRYDEAEQLYNRVLAIREQAFGPDHPDVAQSLKDLVGLYDNQRKYAQADALYWRALAIYEKGLGPENSEVALADLVKLYAAEGRNTAADPLYGRALATSEKTLGSEHAKVATSPKNYAALLLKTSRDTEAEEIEARAKAIRARHAQDIPVE